MCGIVGVAINGCGKVRQDLLEPLKRLEYRGYDSCGFALNSGVLEKDVGKISEFINNVPDQLFQTGVAHTRWATHGGKTIPNAHPHTNSKGTFRAVHNGIIENNEELRELLESKGYTFLSETDTEVIPHYFDYHIGQGFSIEETIEHFFKDVRGTYAILITSTDDKKIYAFKKDSPLVLGLAEDRNIVASDIYCFTDKTDQAIFFDDNEYAVICSDEYHFYDAEGNTIQKEIIEVQTDNESDNGEWPHHMIKEIHDQPQAANRLIHSLQNDQSAAINEIATLIRQQRRVVFVACGTSYHASLIGGAILSRLGFNVHNIIASEFDTFYKVDSDTLIVAISQSGETMDVVTVIKEAKAKGAKIASLTNVPFSTIQRESQATVNIVAGQEVAVASTKAFTNQVIALFELARLLGADIDLTGLPDEIAKTIELTDNKALEVANQIHEHDHVFFLGRGLSYPVAREMALKLKEISYIHADGLMAGELKHGTIALIDPDVNTPVINLISNNDHHMISSAREVEARGAQVITITNTDNGDFALPFSNEVHFALHAVIVGQLISYYTAVARGCDVDQPRNLAKSVTVH